MKFLIFLAIVMAIFPTIEVQGNVETGADNRKIWFGRKMDEVLDDINKKRRKAGKTTVGLGAQLKNAIVNSAHLRDLFRNDYNRNEPRQIVGTEPSDIQLEVILSGSSYTKLSRYAGKYIKNGDEKIKNKPVWVKQPGGQAIWFRGEGEGWRIGSIREKDRNTDNTAFKSNRDGADPTQGGQWKFRFRNTLYRDADGIIRRPSGARFAIFDDRRSLNQHVSNFRTAFEGLIRGRDKVVTCIQTYNNYEFRPKRFPNYNCGDPIGEPGTPCGGNGVSNAISINDLAWLGQQIPNIRGETGIQEILRRWISENTPRGRPHNRRKVELTTTGSIRGYAARSLNTMDRLREGRDLKAHFYFSGINA